MFKKIMFLILGCSFATCPVLPMEQKVGQKENIINFAGEASEKILKKPVASKFSLSKIFNSRFFNLGVAGLYCCGAFLFAKKAFFTQLIEAEYWPDKPGDFVKELKGSNKKNKGSNKVKTLNDLNGKKIYSESNIEKQSKFVAFSGKGNTLSGKKVKDPLSDVIKEGKCLKKLVVRGGLFTKTKLSKEILDNLKKSVRENKQSELDVLNDGVESNSIYTISFDDQDQLEHSFSNEGDYFRPLSFIGCLVCAYCAVNNIVNIFNK